MHLDLPKTVRGHADHVWPQLSGSGVSGRHNGVSRQVSVYTAQCFKH